MSAAAIMSENHRLPRRQGERMTLPRHFRSPDPDDPDAVRSWLASRPRPWAMDLFSGAGGLSLGLEEADFSVVAAGDADAVAMETHAANIQGLTWIGDLSRPDDFLSKLEEWGIDDVDLLVGGPPCQPFSRAGTAKIGHLVRVGVRRVHDERADLWQSFFTVMDQVRPRAVLFENVPDFTRAQGGAPLIALTDELRARGYDTHVDVLDAWKYGVPQHRSRLFVVGTPPGAIFEWPSEDSASPTLWQAIGDLPSVEANTRDEVQPYLGQPESELGQRLREGLSDEESYLIRDHVTRAVRAYDAEIYRLLKEGDKYIDVLERLRRYRSDIFEDKYFRLSCDELSRTITAHIAKDGYWYIHPHQDRTLSIREAARIQTFPDRFRFAGRPSNRYRQIGNAVPPMLASAIGSSMREALGSGLSVEDNPLRCETVTEGCRDDLLAWFRVNRRQFPWRDADLNPWQVLMLEMCLHRTRAEQVERVAERLISHGETPGSFLANFELLKPDLETLGLRWRIDNLIAAGTYIRDELHDQVPDSWQELMSIPGVGDYIASAVLCFAFGRSSVLMDTNTRRIALRVLGEDPKGSDWQLRLFLHELAGDTGADALWNQALLDLGALVCKARAPTCVECPIRRYCCTGSGHEHTEWSMKWLSGRVWTSRDICAIGAIGRTLAHGIDSHWFRS